MKLHLFMDALSKSFDGNDHLSSRALGGIDARDHRLAIYEHRTGTALGFFTADLCADEAQSLAQKA
jgi:hypothetical protein